jgi:hypothetical protein
MIERWPPKANALLCLYFLMHVISLPQTREPVVAIANPVLDACNRPIGSNGAMIWGRHCPIHGERAKPLERAAVAAHFDCCVLCVCLWFAWATFSDQSGRKSTSAKAKWLTFAQSYHEICTQRPQILIARHNNHVKEILLLF